MTNTQSQKKWFLASFAFTLLSLATHGYLSLQHFQLKLGLAAEKSFCNINATFNCDAVAASSYSSIAGVPVAVLGFLIHIVLLILLFTAFLSLASDNSKLKRYAFYLSAVIALTSVVMGVISVTLVGSYCLFCMAAYALSFLNAVAIYKIRDASDATVSLPQDILGLATDTKWVGILLLLVPVAGFISNSVVLDSYGYREMKAAINDSISNWQVNPQQNFNDQGLVYYKGTGEPKMTIVEFADFRCIHCKMAYPPLHAFTEARNDVKLVFKFFPLDGKCNKAIQHQGDGLTCKLAATTYCAEKVSQRGWDAHHWIFDNQGSFVNATEFPDYLTKMGMALKMDTSALQACIDSDETTEVLNSTGKEGGDAKIQGTPAIFVNGRQLNRGQTLPVLEAVYQQLK